MVLFSTAKVPPGLIASALLAAGAAQGAILATWNGQDGTTQPGTAVDPAITATSDLSRGAGLSAGSGSTFNSRGWDGSTDFASAVTDGHFLSWGITIAPATTVENLTITVAVDRSLTGPVNFAFALDTGSGFTRIGPDLVTPEPVALRISDPVPGPLTGSVTFGLVAWGASGSLGTADIEFGVIDAGNTVGVQVEGTVVPEPATALLSALGILFLFRRRM